MANELIPDDAEHPNVLHALVRKRAEISGKIEYCQLELRRLIGELDHVDATIRVFNPNIDVGNIRPKKPLEAVSFRGEVTRVVFNTLREADGPMTCRDIAKHLMAARGLPLDDQRFFLMMTKRVGACLNVKRRTNRVRVVAEIDGLQAWELVR